MELSSCQKAINEAYLNTNSNITIQAGAGSGKTSTLLMLAKNTPLWKKSIFLCFNKSIQQELAEKLPPHINSSTLHSLGMKQLLSHFHVNLKVNEIKTFSLIVKEKSIDLSKFNTKKKQNAYLFGLCKLWDLYRINLLEDLSCMEEIALQNDLIITEKELQDMEIVIRVMNTYNSHLQNGSYIDFTDMLYLCRYISKENFKQYDIVMIDECQDLSAVQKMIVDKIIKPGGRFIAVGDENQSIYAFVGSNIRSFQAFKEASNTVNLPLNITYRCAKKIVDEANSIFDGMIAFEKNPEGSVLGKIITKEDGSIIGMRGDVFEAEAGDLIICRNNGPLVELFLEFLKRRKLAHIYGKDIGEGLQKTLELVGDIPGDQVGPLLEIQYEELIQELIEKGIFNPHNHQKATSFREKIDMILLLLKHYGSVRALEEGFKTIFSNESGKGITLMSIHKSKGLEADKVWFYKPELLPSKYAQSEDMLRAEKCLYYVAVTRARNTLIYC